MTPTDTKMAKILDEALNLVLRGHYGSVSAQEDWDRFTDSMTLRNYIDEYGIRFPGRTTVLENLNILSEATLSYVVNCQLEYVLGTELDDFQALTIDSTSVHANSAWPTDIGLITRFINRAYRLGQCLAGFGLSNFRAWSMPR